MVTQDRAQSMYNATICHRSALPCFPYARRSGALAAVAGQTTTAAIKKDEAQERIEAPHSRAGRRLSRTGRVGHRGFHGAGERKRASLKLFCAAPFLGPPRASKRVGGGGSNLGVFLSKHQNNNTQSLRAFYYLKRVKNVPFSRSTIHIINFFWTKSYTPTRGILEVEKIFMKRGLWAFHSIR